MPYVRALN